MTLSTSDALAVVQPVIVTAVGSYSLYVTGRFLYGYYKNYRLGKRIRDTLPGPKQEFLLGNLKQVVANPIHKVLGKWTAEYGPIYRLRFLTKHIVVLTHPETIYKVLRAGPDYMPKFMPSYKLFESINEAGVTNILASDDTPYWRAVRKATAPAFTTSNLKAVFPDVVALTEHVVSELSALGPTDSADMDLLGQRLTMDVIGRFAFGRDFGAMGPAGSTPNAALQTVGNLLKAMQLRTNPLNRLFPWRAEARFFFKCRAAYNALLGGLVSDLQANPPPANTVFAHLLNVTDPATGKPLTFNQLKAETGIFLIAGYETTAHSIGWAVFAMATHPEVQDKVAAELAELGIAGTTDKPSGRPVDWSDLGRLRYLDALINETLRMYPVASNGTGRCAQQDVAVEGYTIPKGALVWMPFWSIHRNERIWGPTAERFDPDRWLAAAAPAAATAAAAATPEFFTAGASEEAAAAAATAKRGGFLPFSSGPRDCVGQSLALMEMRVALATLVAKFRFELAPEMGGFEGVEANARQHITLKPTGGMMVRCTPRAVA